MLSTVYMLIVISPLASLAMHSKSVAHAVTGECSGDCDICGCSQESRANHSCCCAKKKQMQGSVAKLSADEGCAPKATNANDRCRTVSQPVKPVDPERDCCVKNRQHQNNENVQASQSKEERSKNKTVYKCGCPCGKGRLLALTGFGSNELLPINTSEKIELPYVATLYTDLSHRLTSRHGDPPDPPPRLIKIS